MHAPVFHEDCKGIAKRLGQVYVGVFVVVVNEECLVVGPQFIAQSCDDVFHLARDAVFKRSTFLFVNFELPFPNVELVVAPEKLVPLKRGKALRCLEELTFDNLGILVSRR